MIRYFVILIGISVVIGGCSKWLDLKPESEIILDDFWQTESQAKSVVAGCYKALTSDDCMSRMILWGEGRSDNVTFFDTNEQDLRKMVSFDLTASNGYCKWGAFYTVINYCNTFLHYAPGVLKADPNFTAPTLHQLEGEVYTIRALAYFYLVRTFKNVPWINSPSINDQQNFYITQSSEREVIDSLISNLRTALVYVPATQGSTEYDKGKITKNTVRALLADIYLWDMQYENCVLMCNQIMADKGLTLVAGKSLLYDVFYLKNSTESIFELQFGESSESKQYNNAVRAYYGSEADPLVALSFSSFLASGTKSPFNYAVGKTIESEADIRLKDFVNLPYGSIIGVYPIFKYSGIVRTESSTANGIVSSYEYRPVTNSANWIVYRLSDVMLMKAEALVQLNRSTVDLQDALDLVNTTYQRSNFVNGGEPLSISNYQTKDAMERLVLRERQRELLFEGKRWFDLMRRARRINSVGPVLEFVGEKLTGSSGTQINANSIIEALFLPVNQSELDSNPALKQNPYYEQLDTK